MPSPSPATPAKSREATPRNPDNQKPALLDARRLSELVGFLLAVTGLLVLLSLASYLPQDASLNTVAAETAARNWIGPAGAYSADLLFQAFGWVAFLIPFALLIVGLRLLLVRPFEAPMAKALGAAVFVTSLAAILEFFPYTPAIRGVIRGSGLVGYFAAAGLVHTFNPVGGSIVATALLLSSLFLVTRFSFSSAGSFLNSAGNMLARPLASRWAAWQQARAARAAARLKQQVERTRVVGKPPVVIQKAAPQPAAPTPSPVPALAEPAERPAPSASAPRIMPVPNVQAPIYSSPAAGTRPVKPGSEPAPSPPPIGCHW